MSDETLENYEVLPTSIVRVSPGQPTRLSIRPPQCSPRLEALVLGVGDLSASQGMRLGHIGVTDGENALHYPGDVWHYARHRLV